MAVILLIEDDRIIAAALSRSLADAGHLVDGGKAAEAIAAVKGVPVADIAAHSTRNFYRLYEKPGMTWAPPMTRRTV